MGQPLMRESLQQLVSGKIKDAHPGLLMQRGLSEWEEGEKKAKETLIAQIAKIPSPPKGSLYELAFKRWVKNTADTRRFATLTAGICGRLYTGLNSAGTLETGISTSHTYGMPLLAGSSVKGVARSYAKSLGLGEKHLDVLFGDDSDSGSTKAGALVWHDAWFVPANTPPFAAEIITTHHQDYYNGKQTEADEMEAPIPNRQIAAQGSFYFAIECAPGAEAWAEYARNLLFQALQTQGAGSKTASGYGYFTQEGEDVKRSINYIKSIHEAQKQAQAEKQKAAELAAVPAHRQLIQTWQDKLAAKPTLSSGNPDDIKLYNEWKAALESAADNPDFSSAEKAEIAIEFQFKKMEKKYKNWLTGKERIKELKAILAKLRGEKTA